MNRTKTRISLNSSRTVIGIISLLVILYLFPGVTRSAPATEFTVVGPGGGGATYGATISPHRSNEVLVACDMTGAYRSNDGGRTWKMFNLRGTVKFFAFDPMRTHVIYAATRLLWRSEDDGQTWNLVWPNPGVIESVSMESDHADEIVSARGDDSPGQIEALAIDPDHSQHIVAGARNDGWSAVYESFDEGHHWVRLIGKLEEVKKIWIDPGSPAGERTLYVANHTGIMVRVSGQWQRRPVPMAGGMVDVSAGFASGHGIRFYALGAHGILVSDDAGLSWRASRLPGRGARIHAIANSLFHPEVAYASFDHLQRDGKTWFGVARTSDAGQTWQLAWKEDRALPENVHDGWIAANMGHRWGEAALSLAVSPTDPDTCIATDLGRVIGTTDGGVSWEGLYSIQLPKRGWVSTGLDVTNSYGYLFDPFDLDRRFLPSTDVGLLRSEDRGQSWVRSMSGVPKQWANTTYWVEFDPQLKDKMWGVMSGIHDLPRPKMWRRSSVMEYQGGVCLSVDGGRTWRPSNRGMPETAATYILVDPSSPPGKRVLWVAAMGRGVYKSSDDGATWLLQNNGISQRDPLAWRLARASDGTLYVVIVRRSEDGSLGTVQDGAVYKSINGARSWSPLNLPHGSNGPVGITLDPGDPQRIYLAAWGRAVAPRGEGGGIFLSSDGGSTWRHVLDNDQHIYDVTVDTHDPTILYAAGFESSAWRSNDRGEHWTRITGFNFKWGQRVMSDLVEPGMIYITTFGGGVWHGPASGALERHDIATPQLAPEHSR